MRQAYAYGIRAILTTVALLVGYGLWVGGSSDAVPPDFQPADAGYTAVAKESLSVGTWNLKWLDAPGRGEVPRTDADYETLSNYARSLDADIVAIQEVASLRALERVFNPRVYQFELSRRIGEQRVGFAIKRGLEITRYDDVVDLSRSGEYRYGVDIGLQHDDRTLRLLAVHLASGCQRETMTESGDDSTPVCSTLTAQSRDIAEWIRQRENQNQDWIVLGDFNRQPSLDDPFWRELQSAHPSLVPTRDRQPDCHDGRYPNHIDHFLIDRDITSWAELNGVREITYSPADRDAHPKTLSDHCPLKLTLQLQNAERSESDAGSKP